MEKQNITFSITNIDGNSIAVKKKNNIIQMPLK